MRRPLATVAGCPAPALFALAALLAGGCGLDEPTGIAPHRLRQQARQELAEIPVLPHRAVCNGGRWHCFAEIRTEPDGRIKHFHTPSGFGPADLADAYEIDTAVDPGATIAVADAFGYPNAATDLDKYRSHFGLPACTVASGCLKIVNQSGKTSPLPSPPPAHDDWTLESALDLDMASAACPHCKLVLVEADNDFGDGLFVAQNAAARLGDVVSDSFGTSESGVGNLDQAEADFKHPGVAIFVSSGDSGFNGDGEGPDYPSTSAFVTAVGGTRLMRSNSSARGWLEGAWHRGGSSCSDKIAKPSFQTDGACAHRAAVDVSAVGDPSTGVAVYNKAAGGWVEVGGTSVGAPLVASIYALTGHATSGPSFAYANTGDFFDVSSGSNGNCDSALCNAGTGWDGPTGCGTPNGAVLADPVPGGDAGDAGGGGGCDCAVGATPRAPASGAASLLLLLAVGAMRKRGSACERSP